MYAPDGPTETPGTVGRRPFLRGLSGAIPGMLGGLSGCSTLRSGSPGRLTGSRPGTARHVTLEYMDVAGERGAAHFSPVIRRLEDAFDVSIDLDYIEVPYENLRGSLLTRIGAGRAPDIAAVDQIWLGALIAGGNLLELDEVADDVEFEDYLDEFAAVVQRDGHVYGFPIGTDVRGMYWNRERFASAGLDPDEPPTSWPELIDVAGELHDPPETYGATYFVNAGRWTVNLFAAGGAVLNDDRTEPRFHEQSGVEAAEFLYRLYNEANVTAPTPSYGNGAQAAREFLQGDFAITVVEGSWLDFYWRNLGYAGQDMQDQFGFAPSPGPVDGSPATMSGGFVWTAFADTEHPQIVREFMRLVNERPFVERLMVDTRDVPTRVSLLESSAIWDQVLYRDRVRELLQHARLRPVEHWSIVEEALDPALERIAFGEQDASASLEAAAEQVRSALG